MRKYDNLIIGTCVADMAGENKYVCQLTEASRKVAKEELFEDENERLNAVKAFREWILQQPHITSPTGM